MISFQKRSLEELAMHDLLKSHVTIPDTVLFREIGDEGVLLSVENERYMGLNEVATSFWKYLQSEADLSGVIAHLLEDYAVESSVLEADIVELVEKMVAEGLLIVDNANA
jgi:hypothetical protein